MLRHAIRFGRGVGMRSSGGGNSSEHRTTVGIIHVLWSHRIGQARWPMIESLRSLMSHIHATLLEVHLLIFWDRLWGGNGGRISTWRRRIEIVGVHRGGGHRSIVIHRRERSMWHERRIRWREREVLLERSGRSDYRVVIHIKGVELKRHPRMILVMHREMLLIKGIVVEVCVMVRILGYRHAIDGWNLRREVGWPFPWLLDGQSLSRGALFEKRN